MEVIGFLRDRSGAAAFTFRWEDGFTTTIKIDCEVFTRRGYQWSRDLACKLALDKAQAHCRATRSISKEVF